MIHTIHIYPDKDRGFTVSLRSPGYLSQNDSCRENEIQYVVGEIVKYANYYLLADGDSIKITRSLSFTNGPEIKNF